jgi:two-component system nitrogen regulation response regulator NtrX
VRELKNLVERLAIMTESDVIDEGDLPASYLTDKPVSVEADFLAEPSFKEAKRKFEKKFLMHKLSENKFNISQTADCIGLERSHLHKKIKAYGIKVS